MTAHIVYRDIDPDRPATTSPVVIGEILRGSIGFDGLLMTDDLSMSALGGSYASRTADALAAGCDVVLHCNGDMAEMVEIAGAARPLDANGVARLAKAVSALVPPQPFDRDAAAAAIDGLTVERA
jgi:beta-N-acetylhexosaminidase